MCLHCEKSQGSDCPSMERLHSGTRCWRGIFPRNTRRCLAGSISGRVKTLPMVMRDQGREGNLWRPGRACTATRNLRLPCPLLTECRQCPQGEGREGRASGGEVRGPSSLSLACPISLQGASTGDLLGLSLQARVAIFRIT